MLFQVLPYLFYGTSGLAGASALLATTTKRTRPSAIPLAAMSLISTGWGLGLQKVEPILVDIYSRSFIRSISNNSNTGEFCGASPAEQARFKQLIAERDAQRRARQEELRKQNTKALTPDNP